MYYDLKQSGMRIKELRKMHGYTQEELAERLGISAGHMGKIETGAKGVSIDVMVVISSLFHISLDYLILGKEPESEILKHKLRSTIEFLTAMEKAL